MVLDSVLWASLKVRTARLAHVFDGTGSGRVTESGFSKQHGRWPFRTCGVGCGAGCYEVKGHELRTFQSEDSTSGGGTKYTGRKLTASHWS